MTDQASENKRHENVAKSKPRRKPRELTLETVLIVEDRDASSIDESLNELLTDFLTRMFHEKVETGELVIENGVVRVNCQGSKR